MLALLNDLLEVTQIESGKLSLNLEPVHLRGFLDEAVQQQAMLAAPKGTRVLLQAVPEGTVVVDPLRLRQVVDNLISNAVKFSPPGSTVRVSAERILAGWQVNVQDEGPGITEQDRNRLFQDFARLSAKATGGEKSTGLGLAISRRVVEAHGGQIGVNSEPGHGATFWFMLPDQEMPGDKSSS
jgi:signal transduction histidine kinase